MNQNQTTDWRGLAGRCSERRQFAEAADYLRQALAVEPQNAELWSEFAAVEHQQGHVDAAGAAYERSLLLAPRHVVTLANYGSLLSQTGQATKAVKLLEPALGDTADSAPVWLVLGLAFWALNDLERAEWAIRRAAALAPEDIVARINLAALLRIEWKLTEAERLCKELLAIHPGIAKVWSTLASVQLALGDQILAVEAYRRSLALQADPQRHSSLLVAMQYAAEVDPAALRIAHEAWDRAHARQWLPASPPIVRREKTVRRGKQTLRIGFVSSDFAQHPIAFLALPALEALDKSHSAVICYSDRPLEDEYSARFKSVSDIWRSTSRLSDDQLAAQIQHDEIDVLVDLMGHTGQRLLCFARKPAALQISWLGYVGTTGMAAMDGLIADSIHVWPGEDTHYVERVLRMPNGYACYAPPENAPDVTPLPALTTGHATFGCFGHPSKFSPWILDAWGTILARVPGSRLLLKYHGLDDHGLQARLWRQFKARGIDQQRVLIEGPSKHVDLLASYGRVDLCLDTQPYSGGLTTCEALWMGVPVITTPGRTFAGRHAVSHLTSAGLAHFVAPDLARFVELAVAWGQQPEALAAVRSRMRDQLRRSPLCDAPRFARDFLGLLNIAFSNKSGGPT